MPSRSPSMPFTPRCEDLRARRPLVHNITNYVAMTISANVLLALGASPAMVHAVEEVEDFVAISDAWRSISARCRRPGWRRCAPPSRAPARLASPGCSTRSAAAPPRIARRFGRAGGARAERHSRQCQRNYEPRRAGRRGRQGRRLRAPAPRTLPPRRRHWRSAPAVSSPSPARPTMSATARAASPSTPATR